MQMYLRLRRARTLSFVDTKYMLKDDQDVVGWCLYGKVVMLLGCD
jgi:hypothetical protein